MVPRRTRSLLTCACMGLLGPLSLAAPGCQPPSGCEGGTLDDNGVCHMGVGGGASSGGASSSTTGGVGAAGGTGGGTSVTGGAGQGGTSAGPSTVRVDPNAPTDGSGQSWQDPRSDLQGALAAAAAAGSGEIWVLRGMTILDSSIEVSSGTRLRGGFAGTEETPDERTFVGAPNLSHTVLARSNGSRTPITVSGQDVLLDGLIAAVSVQNSSQVMLDEVRGTLQVADSSRVRVAKGNGSISITNSEVASVNATDLSVTATNSRFMLQGCSNCGPFRIDATSQALFIDTRFVNPNAPESTPITLDGTAAIVGSVFSDLTMGANPPLAGSGTALVFNSSFLNTRVGRLRGVVPRALAIATQGEVSMSSFYQTQCIGGVSQADCGKVAPNVATINNSLFVHEVFDFSENQPFFTAYTFLGVPTASNCATYHTEEFEVVDDQLRILSTLCTNVGDAAALELSRQHLMDFAAPFLVPPFQADLSRYAASGWWQGETLLSASNIQFSNRCQDTGVPDPGAHEPRDCNP